MYGASLQDTLFSSPGLFLQQRQELLEAFTSFETANTYDIMSDQGYHVGHVVERDEGGFMSALWRSVLKSHRGFVADVIEPNGRPVLHLSRDAFFFFSDLHVTSAEGHRLGSIQRRFGFMYKKFDLRDETGQIFARVQSPPWRLWKFPVIDARSGQQVAEINKKWSGALREMFTDADSFWIDFGQQPWTPSQRAVLFATAVSIDFDFFEDNESSSPTGMLDFFD